MKNISKRSFLKKLAGLAGTAVLAPKALAEVDFVPTPPSVNVSSLTSSKVILIQDRRFPLCGVGISGDDPLDLYEERIFTGY